MATMYDSTDPGAIPSGADLVAGYVDGLYKWPATAWKPWRSTVTIAVEPSTPADVLDVETGNPTTPALAIAWVTTMRAAGRRPTLYCNRSTWPDLAFAFDRAGVIPPAWWIADWTSFPHDLGGASAVQYANPETSGGHYDLSLTQPGWPFSTLPSVPPVPGVPPAPPKPPQPVPGGFMPPTLIPGSLSGAVRNAQRLLNVHAQNLAVDGNYGPATEQSVRNVQHLFRLAEDGICGPVTWTVLCSFG